MRIKVKEKETIILYEVTKCEIDVKYDGITRQPHLALMFWSANNDFGYIYLVNKETGLALQEELFKNGYLDLTKCYWHNNYD